MKIVPLLLRIDSFLRKRVYRLQQFLCCYVLIRFCGNVFTASNSSSVVAYLIVSAETCLPPTTVPLLLRIDSFLRKRVYRRQQFLCCCVLIRFCGNLFTASNSSSVVAYLIVSAETCLPTRCLAGVACIRSTIPGFNRHVKYHTFCRDLPKMCN
jgi:uncharacterized membrane protein